MLVARRVVRLVADGLDAAVRADPAGGVHDLLGRVAVGDVDRRGAEPLGQGQPVAIHVDHEDPGRPAQVGAVRGQQPDRARAEHGHRVAGAHAGQGRAVVAGREDVRQHREVALELGSRRQRQQVEVGERDPQVLGLAALVRAHLRVAVRGPVDPFGGVGPQAERGPAGDTVTAGAAGDVERHRDPVTGLDPGDPRADLLDDPHVLVAEHLALFHVGAALVHVQVGAADVGRGDPHDRVVRGFDPRRRNLLHRHAERPLVHNCLHGTSESSPCRYAGRIWYPLPEGPPPKPSRRIPFTAGKAQLRPGVSTRQIHHRAFAG